MLIGQATKFAMGKNFYMYRKTVDEEKREVKARIKPTNSYECCYLVFFSGKGAKCAMRCWNPTADDLMADDWEVVEMPKEVIAAYGGCPIGDPGVPGAPGEI